MSGAAKPLTTAEVSGLLADDTGSEWVHVRRCDLLATTRALERVTTERNEISAEDEAAHAMLDAILGESEPGMTSVETLTERLPRVKAALEMARANDRKASRALDAAEQAVARAREWQAMAEAAQADVERLVAEKAELVAALERILKNAAQAPDLDLTLGDLGWSDEQAAALSFGSAALAKAKGGG